MSGRYPDQSVSVPVNLHTWEHLTFLHWPYDVATVQRLVPDRLRVQEWDGVTWVGISPFRMARVRVPGLPPPPGWDAFAELNVRSYVLSDDGRDGIWFLTMMVPRLSFLAALRSVGLPYQLSDSEVAVAGRRWDYRFGTPRAVRPPADDWFTAQVEVGDPLPESDRTELVDSLTGRWNAFHRRAAVLWRTPVTHEPWPLHRATVSGRLTAPLRLGGLPEPDGPPMVHAAPAVHARLGSLRPA
ncbi:MAG TPA: DUF2071 domain-containing protein [Ornithinicoccus sp.]|nr:DUF2071 domain-containing protein [Ornithinicoccus sp.]